MDVKDVDTTQSLSAENTIQQKLISYGQEMSQEQILALALGRIGQDEQNWEQNVLDYREQLQQAFENIDKSKRYIYQVHSAAERFRECSEEYIQSKVDHPVQKIEQESFQFHQKFIEGAKLKVDGLLSKIGAWRNKVRQINRIKERTLRINGLINKKYNMKNYLQQMQLVKGLISRVGSRLNSGEFDYKFLEELMSKQLIPYNFYHNYCYNIIFLIISTRIKENSLIVFKQNEYLPELFNHMKNFFTRDVYTNCQEFIKLIRHIRIINQHNMRVEDGFAHLFKPFFIRILQEKQQIQTTSFMKARSLMQHNPFTIQLWKQYEELVVQKYVLWNYQQQNNIRKRQLIHLAELKSTLEYFKKNYKWIDQLGVKGDKIHRKNNFIYDFLKLSLLKVLKPVLGQVYVHSFPKQKLKSYEKYLRQFQDYWFCSIFGKYPNLYGFIGSQLRSVLREKQTLSKDHFEQGELNIDQYYKYYQQIKQILCEQLENSEIGKEFRQLWHEIYLRICSQTTNVSQKQPKCSSNSEFEHMNHIKTLQQRLQHSINNKKAYKKDERSEIMYTLIMNLNLNSCNFFLLKEALKLLDKSVQKQIKMIRDLAYQHLYG